MITIAVGDTHGYNTWKKCVNQPFDKFIFIADYFDDKFGMNHAQQQINNFNDIMAFKQSELDKVECLFGNHDFHYLPTITEQYSGFQAPYKHQFGELLTEAIKNNWVQMCYKQDNFLFTHAGVTQTWLSSVGYTGEEPIDIFINDLFKYQPRHFCFTMGERFSNYGDDITQSPIWVRPFSLSKDKLPGYVHVVGHTQVKQILIEKDYVNLQKQKGIILIDAMGVGEYLKIVDGVPEVCKI